MQPPLLNKISPKVRQNIVIVLVIFLTSSAAFGLGRLSILLAQKEPLTIENVENIGATSSREGEIAGVEPLLSAIAQPKEVRAPVAASPPQAPPTTSKPSSFVASKTGKSYYFPWCGIVKRIKKENQITFVSKEEAEKAGYSPGNCAGMK